MTDENMAIFLKNLNVVVNNAVDSGLDTFVVSGVMLEKAIRLTVDEMIQNSVQEHIQENIECIKESVNEAVKETMGVLISTINEIQKEEPQQAKPLPTEGMIIKPVFIRKDVVEANEKAAEDFHNDIRRRAVTEDVIYEEVVEKPLRAHKPKKEKKPRKLSKFNIFMGKYMTQHKGEMVHKELFKKATEEWRKVKGAA